MSGAAEDAEPPHKAEESQTGPRCVSGLERSDKIEAARPTTRRVACIRSGRNSPDQKCVSGLSRQQPKKPTLLPGQAEGVITSMDTAKQQALEQAQLQAQ